MEFVKIHFSKSIFQKSSTDQQGVSKFMKLQNLKVVTHPVVAGVASSLGQLIIIMEPAHV
jgi:hypothetical protein